MSYQIILSIFTNKDAHVLSNHFMNLNKQRRTCLIKSFYQSLQTQTPLLIKSFYESSQTQTHISNQIIL